MSQLICLLQRESFQAVSHWSNQNQSSLGFYLSLSLWIGRGLLGFKLLKSQLGFTLQGAAWDIILRSSWTPLENYPDCGRREESIEKQDRYSYKLSHFLAFLWGSASFSTQTKLLCTKKILLNKQNCTEQTNLFCTNKILLNKQNFTEQRKSYWTNKILLNKLNFTEQTKFYWRNKIVLNKHNFTEQNFSEQTKFYWTNTILLNKQNCTEQAKFYWTNNILPNKQNFINKLNFTKRTNFSWTIVNFRKFNCEQWSKGTLWEIKKLN